MSDDQSVKQKWRRLILWNRSWIIHLTQLIECFLETTAVNWWTQDAEYVKTNKQKKVYVRSECGLPRHDSLKMRGNLASSKKNKKNIFTYFGSHCWRLIFPYWFWSGAPCDHRFLWGRTIMTASNKIMLRGYHTWLMIYSTLLSSECLE